MEKNTFAHLIAQQLQLKEQAVGNTLALLDEGCTIPFISRYRKERTGGLDEVQIAAISNQYERFKEIQKRKETVVKTITDLGKMTPELSERIANCWDATELEDIYLPYKPKRRTRAQVAREQGLEPLAKLILLQRERDPERAAEKFVKDDVKDTETAIKGAQDIIAEMVSEDERSRQQLRGAFRRQAMITSKVVKAKADSDEAAKYSDYFDWEEPLKRCSSHRLLAMRRGESEGEESGYEEDYAPYEEPAPVRAGESSRRPDRRVRKRYDEDDYTDDFDDGRTYSRGRDRRITVFSVIAAILIGVIIIVIAAVKLGVITPGGDASAEAVSAVQSGETVSMPDVAGKDAEEARQQLQQLGLVVETTWAESDQYDSGLVISSSVEAGQSVAAGTSVVLTVSAGQNGIEVPYVTGLTRPEAKATLEKKGLRVDVQEEFSDTVEKDSVLSQDPAAGVSIPSGSTVTITVSSGPDTEGKIAVPSLYGMSADEARQALESAGLAIGNTTTQDTDDDTLVDKVLSQDIVKDTMVDPGTAVSVVIGTGTAKATYSYSGSIPAPTAEEAPDYVPGTQVYIVLFADDGTKLLDTTTTEFPYGPVSYVGLSSASGTLSMSYVSAAGDANGGSKTIQRVIQFTPEQ